MWSADRTSPAWLLAAFLLGPLPLSAQTDSARASRPDTAFRPLTLPDTLASDTAGAVMRARRPAKSPWLAVGLSAVAPGAGQIYTENYWKAPVIWALGAYWIYEWTRQNDRYREFSDLYAQSITPLTPGGNENLRRNRDFYRDERDKFAWFIGGLYFLNLLDAYVGAHLYDFDVSPDLTSDGRIVPRVTASVRLTF